MEKLYRETKTKLIEINELLGKFESRAYNLNESESSVKERITNKCNEITTSCDQLDIYVTREPSSRKYDAKMKVDQLKYDFQHYKSAFNTIQYKKEQKLLEERRREELINSTLSVPNHVQLNMDNDQSEIRHHNRLHRANDELDRMIVHGENALDHSKKQNSMLKDIKRKMFNVSNTLGLSGTLIRMIERRNTSDVYVLLAGMFITIVVMILTVKYLI